MAVKTDFDELIVLLYVNKWKEGVVIPSTIDMVEEKSISDKLHNEGYLVYDDKVLGVPLYKLSKKGEDMIQKIFSHIGYFK